MSHDPEDALAGLTRRPPADGALLERLFATAPIRLPDDYMSFMASSDGAEGDFGERWIEIWPVSRVLAELDSGPRYEGVVLFAGDGANTVYGFDGLRDGEVVEGDWIALDRAQTIPRGPFARFIRNLADTHAQER